MFVGLVGKSTTIVLFVSGMRGTHHNETLDILYIGRNRPALFGARFEANTCTRITQAGNQYCAASVPLLALYLRELLPLRTYCVPTS